MANKNGKYGSVTLPRSLIDEINAISIADGDAKGLTPLPVSRMLELAWRFYAEQTAVNSNNEPGNRESNTDPS